LPSILAAERSADTIDTLNRIYNSPIDGQIILETVAGPTWHLLKARLKVCLSTLSSSLLRSVRAKPLITGLLDDYRNIGNEKQIVWEGLTLTHASRSKKVYADEIVEKLQAVKDSIAEEIKLIEYEATRRRQFTKKITEYWTLKLGAQ
jgi:hypothetical protein